MTVGTGRFINPKVKFLAKLIVRLVAILAAVILLTLAYLHVYGLPEPLQKFLLEQLAQAGIAAKFSSIRLDLFRGVVATDAVLADAREPDQTLATIDEVQLEFDIKRAMNRKNVLSAIRIANAVMSVPTPPDQKGAEEFTASDAYATFNLTDDGVIEIDRLTGVYCGIRLNVSGRVRPRTAAAEEPPRKPEAGKGQFQFITKAVRELNQIQVTLPPQLDLDFDLDLARPLDGKVVARLRGSELQYRGVKLDSAAVDIGMADGAIRVSQFLAKMLGGELSITGRYDIAMGQIDFGLASTIDPTGFKPVLPPDAVKALEQLHVLENPNLHARYVLSAETGTLPQLTGSVDAGTLDFRGVRFNAIKFAFENKGPELNLTGVSIVMPDGELTGQGQYNMESSDFSYQLDSTLNPTRLLPLMTPVMRRIVEPSWFETSPHIVASVMGDFVDPDLFGYDAQLTTGRCSYRGVMLESASAKLHLRESRLDAQNVVLKRPEGDVRGTLFSDFNNHRVNFDLEISANPNQTAGLLGEKATKILTPYRFGPVTQGHAQGVVDFENPAATAWTAQVVNQGFSYWKLTADRAQASLLFTNNTFQIDDFTADLYEGKLRGKSRFVLGDADATYRFDFNTENVDVSKLLTDMRGPGRKVTGVLKGAAELEGQGSDLAALKGKGNLEITDGVLWEVPLFGIFSQILGTTKATSAKGTFTIVNQKVKTDDLTISAGAFTATSRGNLEFNGKLDFRVEAQFLRAWPGINIISKILGQILEYKVGGTISNPSYRSVNLPKELLPHD